MSVRGTFVKMGGSLEWLETDVATHLPVRSPGALADLQKLVCSKKRANACFETISLGNGKARFVFINSRGNTTAFDLERVAD